jgi:hypothetical protein
MKKSADEANNPANDPVDVAKGAAPGERGATRGATGDAAKAAAGKAAAGSTNGEAEAKPDDPWARAARPSASVQPEPPDLTVLQINRRAPPTLPLDVFGDRWAAWIRTGAKAACCPPDYVVAPLLTSTSALIGNSRWAQGTPGWIEPPAVDIASVGDSGDSKSPGGDILFKFVLPVIERRMLADFPGQLATWKVARQIAEAKEKLWQGQVTAALKKGNPTPPRPTDIDIGPEPQRPRLVQNDVTIEKVSYVLATAAPKGLLVHRDELAGFLLGMTSYNDAGRQFWLESYGGRPYKVERVKLPEPIIVPYLTCSIFGTIQAEKLSKWLGAEPDDGFASRFCWFWPEPIPFKLSTVACDTTFAIEALDLLRRLEMFAIAGELSPVFVPLVEAAWPALERFGQQIQNKQRMTTGLLRSAYGKARGLALRLALIIEHLWWAAGGSGLTSGPPTVISEAAFEAACRFVSEYTLPMAARVYGDAAADVPQRNAAMLARWIAERRHPAKERPTEVHVRTMQRQTKLPGLHSADDIHAACKELVEARWLLPGTRPGGNQRLRAAYPINPALWEALDASPH